jgi:hypothetical protein
MQPHVAIEGSPDVWADRLGARVDGWNNDLVVSTDRLPRPVPRSRNNWHGLWYRPASSRAMHDCRRGRGRAPVAPARRPAAALPAQLDPLDPLDPLEPNSAEPTADRVSWDRRQPQIAGDQCRTGHVLMPRIRRFVAHSATDAPNVLGHRSVAEQITDSGAHGSVMEPCQIAGSACGYRVAADVLCALPLRVLGAGSSRRCELYAVAARDPPAQRRDGFAAVFG